MKNFLLAIFTLLSFQLSAQCLCESKTVRVDCGPCGELILDYGGDSKVYSLKIDHYINNKSSRMISFFDGRGQQYNVGWDKVINEDWSSSSLVSDWLEECTSCVIPEPPEPIDLTPIFDKLCDIYEQDSTALAKTCEIAENADSTLSKLCELVDINTEGFESIVTSLSEITDIQNEQLDKLCEIAESDTDSLLLEKMCDVFEQDSLNNIEFASCLDSIKLSLSEISEALTEANEISNELLDKLCAIDSTLTESKTDSILQAWCEADSAYYEEVLANDSLTLLCLVDIKELLEIETLDVEVIPYCVDGAQVFFEAIYNQTTGVLENADDAPQGQIGFCPSTDTTDYEKLERFVCARISNIPFPVSVVATDCYENGVLVGTVFSFKKTPIVPLNYVEGTCDYDVETVIYCLDGETLQGEVLYLEFEQVNSTVPEGAQLGFCNPSDTVDYELYSSFICVDGQTVERIRCYENKELFGTIYEPNIEVLEFELGACNDPIYGVNSVCFVVDDVEVEYKEFCYKDLPSVYQDQDGEVVDITGLEKCIDICLDTETSSDLVCIEVDGNSFYAFAVIDITSECQTGQEIDRENYYVDLDGATYTNAELSEDCEGEPIEGKVCSDGVTYNTITTGEVTTYYNLGGIEVDDVKVEYYGECIEPISVIKSCAVLDGNYISGLLYSGEGNNYFTDFDGNILLEATPYCCDDCIYLVGCYDLRTTTMNSITLCDGTIIGVQDLVDDGRPNSVNDGIKTITTFFGGYGESPDGTAGSLICDGTNRHSIEIYNTNACIASFQLTTLGVTESVPVETFGECNKETKAPSVVKCYGSGVTKTFAGLQETAFSLNVTTDQNLTIFGAETTNNEGGNLASEIADCVEQNGEATLTWIDQLGNSRSYKATSIIFTQQSQTVFGGQIIALDAVLGTGSIISGSLDCGASGYASFCGDCGVAGAWFSTSTGREIPESEIKECTPEVDNRPTIEVCYLEGENGIIGQRWDSELNAATWGEEAFTSATTHANGMLDESVVITNNWSLNDLDFPVTGAFVGGGVDPDISSQEIYKATLCVDKPTRIRDNNGNTGEFIDFHVGDCNKDFVKKASTFTTGTNRGLGEFYCLPIGCTDIVININDYSVYGGFLLQYYDEDTDAWVNFPMSQTYQYQPTKVTKTVYVESNGTYTNLDGSVFAETIFPCETPCYPLSREAIPDTEVSIINACLDVDGDPANYIPVTQEIIFTGGEQTSVGYYQNYGDDSEVQLELDGRVFVDCATGEPIDEPVVPLECESTYVVTAYAPIGDNGVNFEYWNDLNQTYTAQQQAADIFSGDIDYSGMPAINSNEGEPQYRKEADLFIRDPDVTQNAYRFWTYIYLTEPVRIREYHPTAESFAYFDGECQTTPTLAASGEYFNNTLPSDFDKSYAAGIHYLGGEVYDFSAWGFTRYQYSDDNGVTWKNIPASWLYCKEPTLSECQVQVCTKENGVKVLTDIETCLPLGSEYTLKKPTLCSGELAVASEPQCAPQTFYKINLGEVGTTEYQWTGGNVGPASTAAGSDYLEAFSLVDNFGYPLHPNAPDATTLSSPISSTTNVGGGIVDDQAMSDFWIYLDKDTELREFNATAEAASVWIGGSCGSYQMTEVVNAGYTNTVANPIGVYPKGYYRVRLYHSDATANGVSRLQGLTNGKWSNLTAYKNAPTFEVIKGWYCSDGNNYNQDRSETLDETWLCEDPRCAASNSCKVNIVD